MKKLSIITINKDNAAGLANTINSVRQQNPNLYEYIVIDGGSTDGSIEIIEQNKAYIQYFVSEKDKGIYNAMNKGAKVASGQYLLFLNSGDVFYDSSVVERIFVQDQCTADFLLGGIRFVRTAKSKRGLNIYPPKELSPYDIIEGLSHQSTFTKRSLFLSMGGYNESLKIVSDWALLLEAKLVKDCSIQTLPLLVSVYSIDGLSSTQCSKEIIRQEKEAVLAKLGIKFDRKQFNRHRWCPRILKIRLFYKLTQG